MPTSTPCPAARRGVRVADGLKYHIHSEWNHPSMSSQWGEGCGVEDTGSHFDPTLVRVCVCTAAHRPASRFRQMPAASCPRASGQQPGPARSAAVAEQCGCAATAPFRCPVLFGAGAAARGDRR